jgi:hypothetical protein
VDVQAPNPDLELPMPARLVWRPCWLVFVAVVFGCHDRVHTASFPAIPPAPAVSSAAAPSPPTSADSVEATSERLAFVDAAARVWVVSLDASLRETKRENIATLASKGDGYSVTGTQDGRYLAWDAPRLGNRYHVGIYDFVTREQWSFAPKRQYDFMGPTIHGFVFYENGPAFFAPRTSSGARNEDVPSPRRWKRKPEDSDEDHPPRAVASLHDRILVAVSHEGCASYGGPQALYAVGLRGDVIKVADESPSDPYDVVNLPITALTPDATGDLIADIYGTTAGRGTADYYTLVIRDARTWRVVAKLDAGCWENPEQSPHSRCRKTPSWLAPGGRGGIMLIQAAEGQSGDVYEIRGHDKKLIATGVTHASRSRQGTLLTVKPSGKEAGPGSLVVERNGARAEIARDVEVAMFLEPIAPDDSAMRVNAEAGLDPADRDYGDPLRGRGWSDRCLAHFHAGHLPSARAACEMGLLLMPDDEIRGALEHNLALVEEKAGNSAAACNHIRASLSVRPNNAISRQVASRLECQAVER